MLCIHYNRKTCLYACTTGYGVVIDSIVLLQLICIHSEDFGDMFRCRKKLLMLSCRSKVITFPKWFVHKLKTHVKKMSFTVPT